MAKKQLKSLEMSKFPKNIYIFKKLSDNDKAEILFNQNQEDHAIDLMKNTKSLYMSLYNLSLKKLTKLYYYLNNILNRS